MIGPTALNKFKIEFFKNRRGSQVVQPIGLPVDL